MRFFLLALAFLGLAPMAEAQQRTRLTVYTALENEQLKNDMVADVLKENQIPDFVLKRNNGILVSKSFNKCIN